MTYRVADNWTPVWWSPVLWAGSAWSFSARLTGLAPGAITGAALVVNGRNYPVEVAEDIIQFTLSASQADQVPAGAVAELFLDTTAGRVLWIRGRVTRGGTP